MMNRLTEKHPRSDVYHGTGTVEILRRDDREKSARFRELLGKKLTSGSTLILLKAYDPD